jgi:hypothetical protein
MKVIALGLALTLGVGTACAGSLGDANCDGVVNAVDARHILVAEVWLVDTVPCPSAADVNLDGAINSIDALLILQLDAGIIEGLP